MDDREKQRKMGERLVALRRTLIHHAINHYSLKPWDAEDLYTETCIYMLERGYQLLRLDRCFDAAIRNTMRWHTLNHLRSCKRIVELEADKLEVMGSHQAMWTQPYETEFDWIHELDKPHIMDLASGENEAVAMSYLLGFDGYHNIREAANKHNINLNTAHGALRRIRQRLKEYLDD